jgi:hypothetical protein
MERRSLSSRNVLENLDLLRIILSYICGNDQNLQSSPIILFALTFRNIYEQLFGNGKSSIISSSPQDFLCPLSLLKWANFMGCRFNVHSKQILQEVAAERGLVDVLEWAEGQPNLCLDNYKELLKTQSRGHWGMHLRAARGGHVSVLQWMNKHEAFNLEDNALVTDVLGEASTEGQTSVFEWLLSHGQSFGNQDYAVAAAVGGHVNALEYLVKHDLELTQGGKENLAFIAVYRGNLCLLKWLIEHLGVDIASMDILDHMFGVKVDMLVWLRSQHPPCPWPTNSKKLWNYSPATTLRWMLANGCPVPTHNNEDDDNFSCIHAIETGDLEALALLRSLDPPCPWSHHGYRDTNEWKCAAENGDTNILAWMKARNTMPRDKLTIVCTVSAEGGHTGALQWFRNQDPPCEWDYKTFIEAVAHQHVACVQWLIANHCPQPTQQQWKDGPWLRRFDRKKLPSLDMYKVLNTLPVPFPWFHGSMLYAYEAEGVDAVLWMRAQNPPCQWGSFSCTQLARHGDLRSLKLLLALDPPCPHNGCGDACTAAASEGHLHVLKFLRYTAKPAFPWSAETTAAAVLGGWFDVLQWLRSQKPTCPITQKSCDAAVLIKRYDILRWLRSQKCPTPWGLLAAKAGQAHGIE